MEQTTEMEKKILKEIKEADPKKEGKSIVISELGFNLGMNYYSLKGTLIKMEKKGLVKIHEVDFGSRKKRSVSLIKRGGKA